MRLRRIGFVLLGFALLLLLGVGALAWRLDRGPIAVPALLPRLEAALDPPGPGRVEIAEAAIAWRGWGAGGLAPVELRLAGITAHGAEGEPWLEAPQARLALSPAALLRGRAAPQRVDLHGARLRLQRTEDGGFTIGAGGEGAGTLPDLAALTRPGSPLATLEHVAITDAELRVRDARLGETWALRDVGLTARRGADGALQADGGGTFEGIGQQVPLQVAATLATEPLRLRLQLDLPAVNPARLAPLLPALEVLDAPASVAAVAVLDAGFELVEASLSLQAQAGAVDVPSLGKVPFQEMELRLAGTPQAVRLERLQVGLPSAPDAPTGTAGPVLVAEGTARLAEGRWQAEADLALDRALLGALETWWPEGLAGAGRGWVAANLIGGVLREGRWHLAATAPETLDSAELTAMSGTAQLDDLAIRWHPDLPPLEGLSGEVAFTPDGITLAASEARQAGTALRLTGGELQLSGLGPGPARAELQGRLVGPVADLWALLRDPGLGLLAGRDLPIHDPTGELAAEVAATVPLSGPNVAREPYLRANAELSDLRLPEVVLGQTLRDGAFTLRLADGLRAEGTGVLGEVPVRTEIALDFADAPGEALGVTVTARARPEARQLAAFGFDVGDWVTGPVGLALRYTARGPQPARLAVDADLEPAVVTIAPFGYRKPAGRDAQASAVLRLQGGGIAAVESLEAEGPALRLRGAAENGVGPGATLLIREARFGETRFTGRLRRPEQAGGAWSATVEGPVLDLRRLLADGGERPGGEARRGGLSFVLQAQFARVLTPDPAPPLRAVQARVVQVGGALRQGEVSGQVGEAEAARFAASLAPREVGDRLLRVQAGNAGALIAALGYGRRIEGGTLDLVAAMPVNALPPPLEGTAQLSDFTLRDAPTVAKLLQALTGYGLIEALQGPGLGVAQLVLPFRLERDALIIGEARAFSASLGVTATGRIDRRQELLDLRGTVVPAYVFNSLLGNLPIVGRLFSAERGGGLFSAGFTVTGPIADPRITVNPLTALTPGFLRGIFGLGTNGDANGTAAGSEAAPAPAPAQR